MGLNLYSLQDTLRRNFSVASQLNQYWLKNYSLYPVPESFHLTQYYLNASKAWVESWDKIIKDYPAPKWTTIGIEPEEIEVKDFCKLIRFKNEGAPPMLIVAPLSGHYATILKDTVKKCAEDFDVYITDWINCRDIAWEKNGVTQDFGIDDYVDYLIDFMKTIHERHLGEDLTALGVCQPTVPLLVANAYLCQKESQLNAAQSAGLNEITTKKVGKKSKEKIDTVLPKAQNIVLIGGPVDTRQSPTSVNDYAKKNKIEWFKKNVIYPVPQSYEGSGRQVYPGFLQHMGFVSMNVDKHVQSHMDFFNDMLAGSHLKAQKHKDFYDEYNSVMDLPAKYYLETIERVFMNHSLPQGEWEHRGEKIDLANLSGVRLLAMEGELDDISGLGQTRATLNMTPLISESDKRYFMVPGAGHYGLFAGQAWREKAYPQIKDFCLK